MNAVLSPVMSDGQLWQKSREGDREAFGCVVQRYQSLLCSLAYSKCGNLAQSEDLAQEAFIAAWQNLGELREPDKLRAWLCGIVRNLAARALLRERRRGGATASLDAVAELAGSDADPAARAAAEEEAKLLWRSLEALPESYREPMVLFYRQGQSVAEVARSLDLAEEAVRQRLSRGRSMLREGQVTVVETALTRTRPTGVFTVGVLAALPAFTASSARAAVIESAASGLGAAAKGVFAGIGKALLWPAVGLLAGLWSAKAAASTARSPQERAVVLRDARLMIIIPFVMTIGLVLALSQAARSASPVWVVFGVLAWVLVLAATVTWLSWRMHHEVMQIRTAAGANDEVHREAPAKKGLNLSDPTVYESKLRFLGLPLIAIGFGGADTGTFRTRKAVGWIALGDVAVSPLMAIGGYAIAPFALGAITVGIFSLSVGAALGVVAFGSAAVGWVAYGLGALGWRGATGGAAVARDYAVGAMVRATETNTPAAREWLASGWFWTLAKLFAGLAPWVILLGVLVLLCRMLKRWWRRPSR